MANPPPPVRVHSFASLRGLDPAVNAILASSSQVALYNFPVDAEGGNASWKRCDIEGSLYIVSCSVKGSNRPRHRTVIVSGKTAIIFSCDIIRGGMKFDTSDQMIMFQDSEKRVAGLWFFVPEEIQPVLDCMKAIADGNPPPPLSPSPLSPSSTPTLSSPPPLLLPASVPAAENTAVSIPSKVTAVRSAALDETRPRREKAPSAAKTRVGDRDSFASVKAEPIIAPDAASLCASRSPAESAATALTLSSPPELQNWTALNANRGSQRGSTAAIARFLLEQSGRTRLEFTHDEFMSLALRKWDQFCPHLSQHPAWRNQFTSSLKNWKGDLGLKILCVSRSLYSVEVGDCETPGPHSPSSLLGRRRRAIVLPTRFTVSPALDDSGNMADRPAKIGRTSGQISSQQKATAAAAQRLLLRDAIAAIARFLLDTSSRSSAEFTDVVFLNTAENNWVELCGKLTKHLSWKDNFKRLLATWSGQCGLSIRAVGVAKYSVEICSSVARDKASASEKDVGFTKLFDDTGRLLSACGRKPTKCEAAAVVIHCLFQKNGCSLKSFTGAEFLSEAQEMWDFLFWPFLRRGQWKANILILLSSWKRVRCGFRLLEKPKGVYILKDFQPDEELLHELSKKFSSAGHIAPEKAVTTVDVDKAVGPPKSNVSQLPLGEGDLVVMKTLQSNAVLPKELNGMGGEQLSLTVAACMINFNEDARFLLTDLASCLRTVFGQLAISGDAIVDFPAELLVPMVRDGLHELDVYKSFGASVTKLLEWRFEKYITGLRQG